MGEKVGTNGKQKLSLPEALHAIYDKRLEQVIPIPEERIEEFRALAEGAILTIVLTIRPEGMTSSFLTRFTEMERDKSSEENKKWVDAVTDATYDYVLSRIIAAGKALVGGEDAGT